MANEVIAPVGEGSAEEVAYKLFLHIAEVEGVEFSFKAKPDRKKADRKWILSTYSECIWAVRTADY